jgi:hypothetical protein
MKRTTVPLEDELLHILKTKAVQRGISMGVLINELLRQSLKEKLDELPTDDRSHKWEVFSCGVPRVDIADRDALYSLMEE